MREIKFRAWDGEKIISPDYIDRRGNAHWKEDSIPTATTSTEYVMQFTGLQDKNGKDIYESDILIVNDGFVGKKRQILWSEENHCWSYKILDDVESALGLNLLNCIRNIVYRRTNDIEIIGNIHENKL
jgi:uncharacterized phage protein (TIGR01671 family)